MKIMNATDVNMVILKREEESPVQGGEPTIQGGAQVIYNIWKPVYLEALRKREEG